MNNHLPKDPFETNLEALLRAAFDKPDPRFQERLQRDVHLAIQQQDTGKPSVHRLRRFLIGAAAIILVAASIWVAVDEPAQPVAQVTTLYGHVTVEAEGASEAIQASRTLASGARVQTAVGSRAQILLGDQSRLLPDPRTILQVDRTRQGPTVSLTQGAVTVEARKQAPGQQIGIRAGSSHIKVLGTRLDVRLVKKPDGTEQTRVRVLSGRVEVASGGHKVLVLPGTEAVADAGQAPVRSSLVFEVNELIRLFQKSQAIAEASGQRSGLPMLVDYTSDTLWAVVPNAGLRETGGDTFEWSLNYPAFRSRVYTLEGVEVPSQGIGKVLRLDMSSEGSSPVPEYLIVKIPNARGWFHRIDKGLVACALDGDETHPLRLIQFHLPPLTFIEKASPPIIERMNKRNRLMVTMAARVRLPQLIQTD